MLLNIQGLIRQLEETRSELTKALTNQNDEVRRIQRDLEFENNKKAQEYEFEVKTLKNKVKMTLKKSIIRVEQRIRRASRKFVKEIRGCAKRA